MRSTLSEHGVRNECVRAPCVPQSAPCGPERLTTKGACAMRYAMPKRKRLGPEAKMRLLHAYAYRCAICSELLPPTVEIDHITPLGSWLWRHVDLDPNDVRNLQPLCPGCHAHKSQTERMAQPLGSAYACACGDTHSIYFRPQCEVLRTAIAELVARCTHFGDGVLKVAP